jgi:hypothetical protein
MADENRCAHAQLEFSSGSFSDIVRVQTPAKPASAASISADSRDLHVGHVADCASRGMYRAEVGKSSHEQRAAPGAPFVNLRKLSTST